MLLPPGQVLLYRSGMTARVPPTAPTILNPAITNPAITNPAMADPAMADPPSRLLRRDRPAIAYRYLPAATAGMPTLLFFPGYASDMTGTKAGAIRARAADAGAGCLLFDYAGCGQSGGAFADQTLSDWVADALAVVAQTTHAADAAAGPLILIGSSMGGWLMLHAALRLGQRVAGLIGIAAAPDFTDWGYDAAQQAALAAGQPVWQANPYGPDATLTTAALWQSGAALRLLDAPIAIDCPVTLLHGQTDADVPFAISLTLAERLRSAQVRTILIKDGDHRLSRPQDIALLDDAVTAMLARPNQDPFADVDAATRPPAPDTGRRG